MRTRWGLAGSRGSARGRYAVPCTTAATVGLQAEGPNARFAGYSYKDTAYPRCTERFAVLNEFADVHFAIAMDEPIVNNMANTMLVFGLLVPGAVR